MRWGWTWVLAACGEPDGDTTDVTGTDTPTVTDTSETTTTDTDDAPGCAGQLSGRSLDAAGAPYAAIDLRFCRPVSEGGACRYATSDDGGNYAFQSVCAGRYALEFPAPEGSGHATMVYPVTFEDGEVMVADGYVVPLDPATALGSPQSLELGAGLHVSVGIDSLTPPLFHDDATEAAGVALAPGTFPIVEGATTVAAAWNTSPFDYAAVAPLATTVDNLWDLPEGSTWKVWVASYGDGLWLEAGTVTVTGSALVGTVELPLLSTVALVQD